MKWQLRLMPFYALAVLLMCSLIDAKPAKDTKPVDDYYPLQVGNQWRYFFKGREDSPQTVSRITKIETIDGTPLARLEATVDNKVVATEHLVATEKGIYRHRNNNQEITPPVLLLRYPARAGDHWDGEITVAKEKAKYTCDVKEEMVEVPAGKFKAMKVTLLLERTKGPNVTNTYWFVKDVGFVKQTGEAGDLTINMELDKFEPAKDGTK
jgi:hypothetical protein